MAAIRNPMESLPGGGSGLPTSGAMQADLTPNGAYGGLAGIMQLLQGGISQHQFDRLGQGYNGQNGGVGGGVGHSFAGLSPYALNFLMHEPGLMSAIAPKHIDDVAHAAVAAVAPGADGTGGVAAAPELTADQAFMNHLMNGLYASAPKQYQLHSGVTQEGLMGLLQQYRTNSGRSLFSHGYNANGAVVANGNPGVANGQINFTPPPQRGGRNGLRG